MISTMFLNRHWFADHRKHKQTAYVPLQCYVMRDNWIACTVRTKRLLSDVKVHVNKLA